MDGQPSHEDPVPDSFSDMEFSFFIFCFCRVLGEEKYL